MSRRNFFVLFFCCFVLWCGCSRPNRYGKFSEKELAVIPHVGGEDLPIPSGGVVFGVKDEVVSSDEILDALSGRVSSYARGRDFSSFREGTHSVFASAVIDKVSDILIYQKAMQDSPENINDLLKEAVEKEVGRFVVGYDNNRAKAEAALKEGNLNWESFRELQKRKMMIQSYISKELKEVKAVSHGEMVDFYNKKKDEYFERDSFYKFSLIDIVPGKVDRVGDESSNEAALRKAEDLVEQINGGADFAELANKHSHGHRADFGGSWDKVTPGSLASPYDVLEVYAAKMRAGGVVGPIESEGHVFVMKLEDKQEAVHKSFEEVQAQIESQIQMNKRRADYEELVESLIKQANIEDMDRFVSFCVESAYRKWSLN